MASRNNKRSASALDPLMAGFAGGAAAFIVYAMPQARFDDLVALSGLPMFLSAAQPPLGATARGAVMLAAGVGSFLLVWFVLRALSKSASKPKRRAGTGPIEMEPPRLRRADMHPDAPSRRPILAGVDLGRSFDELPSDEDSLGREPNFGEMNPPDGMADDETQPAYDFSAYAEGPVEDLPAFQEQDEEDLAANASDYEEKQDYSVEADRLADGDEQDAPAFAAHESDEAEHLPVHEYPEAEAERFAIEDIDDEEEEPEVPLALSPRHVQTVHALSHRLPDPARGEASIDNLVKRLEAGLARRHPANRTMPASDTANGNGHAASRDANPLDARLRGAIDELQKLASRGN